MVKQLSAKLANQDGFTTTFFALLMPVIIAMLGLCADGAIVIYQRISLETATDAASRSAIDAYDRNIWIQERKVVLEHDRAEEIVTEVLNKNIAHAEVTSVEIPFDNPSQCLVHTRLNVPLFFLQLFGVKEYTVEAQSQAYGYAEGDGH